MRVQSTVLMLLFVSATFCIAYYITFVQTHSSIQIRNTTLIDSNSRIKDKEIAILLIKGGGILCLGGIVCYCAAYTLV